MKSGQRNEGDAALWVSARTAAFYVGIDPSHITNLKNQGFVSPPTGVTPYKGKYWLPTIMRELYEYAQRQGTDGGSLADRTAELDFKNKELRFRRQEREEAVELNQLIPFDEAVALFVELEAKISSHMENIPVLLEEKAALTNEQVDAANAVIAGVMQAMEEEHERSDRLLNEEFPQDGGYS